MEIFQTNNYNIGTIKIDGIEPTDDFKKYAEKEKRGELTEEDKKNYLKRDYKMRKIYRNIEI